MIRNKAAYKYKISFEGPYEIFQMRKIVAVTLQMGAFAARINILRVNPFKKYRRRVTQSSVGK